ncbi:LysR family transcriptional regulator [Bifidobacterium ramosum]|uniref:LysR family transcriptional regulator n=1 Tax=Bifidobacterium ramosum TaxID=1798158 RepID=A0A6L4X2M2_9BIFI|nr:LysR family transcriptional regulator [Bifidobacterium ramosum]KAB8288820.1 LysR family transcriptional regulator [Bifidobacterium ramosum]NEG71317.1 LysR family transcriptional regulator [Bifidobacterium ramosum]
MYDRRLDALIAAADTGSFAQAARRLHLSTPAVAKQVTTFEQEYGLTIFNRSRTGVTPTPAGAAFLDDARSLVRESDEILRRARQRMHRHADPVRLGISILRPARHILDLWQRAGQTDIRLELVSMPDNSTPIDDIIARLGEDIDAIATAFVPDHWTGICNTQVLSYEPLCLAVPRNHPLARRARLTIDDLTGERIRILPRGNGTDDIARDLFERNPGITLVDIDRYDLDLFNDCAESGDLLISKPMWSDVHPQLVNVPVDWPEPVGMQYGLLSPLSPAPQVAAFVERIAALNQRFADR